MRSRAVPAILAAVLSLSAASGPSPERVAAIKKEYEKKLTAYGSNPSELRVHAIGKSHIDAAFTWRLAETREHKVPYTWSQAIRNMAEYPTFTFHQSSAQFYEWVKQDDPVLFKQIQDAEKQGRWVIVGGMWVEPDANMPDGESMVRQFLYGQRFFIDNFGHGADLVWLEDTFGFNWNLPQIAKKSGANSFYTLKMLWNTHNQFPFHLFYWQAPDGSRLLAHITPILSGVNLALQPHFPYSEFQPGPSDYFLSPITEKIAFPWEQKAGYRQTRLLLKPGEKLAANYLTSPAEIAASLSDEPLPVAGSIYGAGDGGHGPTNGEIRDQLALQQTDYSRISTTGQLFSEFASYSDRLPVWNDELYLEYHQGVFTTHEREKRLNREAESQMRRLESAATLAWILGAGGYPAEEIRALWKTVLLNQFHDILPGTGIREVYQDAEAQYAGVSEKSGQLLQSSMSALAGKIRTEPARAGLKPLLVFNPLGWERQDPVGLQTPAGVDYRVFDPDGRELAAQSGLSEDGRHYLWFSPGRLPALGWKTFYLETGASRVKGGPEVRETGSQISIENPMIKVVIDRKSGWMVSLFDKTTGREMLGGPANKIVAFTDKPGGYPAWNIAENYLEHPIEVPAVSRISVTEQGPMLARVLIEREGKTGFKQWITVHRDSPMVGCVTRTDLHWGDALIKLEFNTSLETDKVHAEIPYAVIARSTRPQIAWDKARTEMPSNKWIDLSDGMAGLALLNFGGHGFSMTPDGKGFRMSIVKAAPFPRSEPDARNVDKLYSWRLKPAFQTDQGEHWSYLALMPHEGDWRKGGLFRAGYEFNTRAEAVLVPAGKGGLPAEFGMLGVDDPSVLITSVKQAEDDGAIIVRLMESSGTDTTARLELAEPFSIEKAWETDLLELNPKPLTLARRSLKIPIGHYEIKTIKLVLK